MNSVLSKIKANKISLLPKVGILFLLFTFLFASICLNDLNNNINDYLFNKLRINMILYGDINDDDGHIDSKKDLNKVKDTIYEIKDYIESNNLANVYVEEYLYTNYIYSANKLNDPNDYTIIFYDSSIDEYNYLGSISKDIENNRHFETIQEGFGIDTSKDDRFFISNYGYVPKIVGVDHARFSDRILRSFTLAVGRVFTSSEIENGSHVCILNEVAYYIDKEGIRQVRTGDKIPLTIDIDGKTKTYEFEVIGIVSGQEGDINIQNTAYYELYGQVAFLPEDYRNMIFIPDEALREIYSDFVDIQNKYNYQVTKNSNDKFSNSVVYYGQNLGVRPVVISINNINSIKPISTYLNEKIDELNKVSNRVIEYKYYSNFDNYVSVIGSLSTNTKLFSFLSIISIILFLIVLSLYIISDIENNKKEIAIRRCLGQNNKNVFKDILIEYLLLGIIPIILALIITYFLSNAYINYINNSFFDVTSGMTVFNNYITKIDVEPLTIITIIKVVILWIISLLISLTITYFKIKNMSIKKVLMEGDL